MVWTTLIARVGEFEPALLNLAFVFLMLGYGTKVGLAPLHAWLPDAHAEGPTPISAVLSGLLLNVALYAVLRFKLLLDANAGAIAPGPLMATLGIVSLIFAAFMLYQRRDIKRLFAFSSIEHMGIIVFAFGIGGPLANFAGLLHMTMHTPDQVGDLLHRRPYRPGQGNAAHRRHPRPDRLPSGARLEPGRSASSPSPGCRRSASSPASSWSSARRSRASRGWRCCWSFGLLLAFGALILRLQGMAFGEPSPGRSGARRPRPCRSPPISGWCCSPGSICRRRWSPGSSTSRRCCARGALA